MKKSRNLQFQQLEDRQLMAADVSFEHGVLRVEMDPGEPTQLEIKSYYYRNRSYVHVVGNGVDFSPRKGNFLRTEAVRQIQVEGTNKSDFIDLSDVEASVFTSLRSTQINGYRKADTIIGSEVSDTIRGGRGKDVIDGQEGRDIIYGGAHDDTIYGGLGRDRIYGQGGNDKIWGNRSSAKDRAVDFIFGGSGYNEADWDPKDRYNDIDDWF